MRCAGRARAIFSEAGKPFGTGELLACIRVAIRHIARPAGLASTIRFGSAEADLDARVVKVAGAEVHEV